MSNQHEAPAVLLVMDESPVQLWLNQWRRLFLRQMTLIYGTNWGWIKPVIGMKTRFCNQTQKWVKLQTHWPPHTQYKTDYSGKSLEWRQNREPWQRGTHLCLTVRSKSFTLTQWSVWYLLWIHTAHFLHSFFPWNVCVGTMYSDAWIRWR